MPQTLSPTQSKILIALAEYKFLTISQMIRLQVTTQRSNLYKVIAPLRDTRRALVREMKFGTDPQKGKLESFYYLSNRGKNVLIENGILNLDEIKYPRGTSTLFSSDYEHRKFTLDCHIACSTECKMDGIELHQFDRYFDKLGNNRIGKNLKAKTSIVFSDGYIIADGSFLISNSEQSRLYGFELYNDRNTKRIVGQLKKHISGIKESALCTHFDIKKGHRVCCVFSHAGIMDSVKERFNEEEFEKFFLFKTYEQAMESFLKNWKDLKGKETDLIDF